MIYPQHFRLVTCIQRFSALLRLLTTAMGLSLGLAAIGQVADAATTIVKVDDNSFKCLRQMAQVRHFYVDNLQGDVMATIQAANAAKGAIYPVGSVVQLVPTEAMVKREAGFSPATGDWEFFELSVGTDGTKIGKRGVAEVNNRFGKNCLACHAPAREPWDYVCETGHGCEAIPIDHSMTGALQRSDPRCGPAIPQDGDTWALLKLRTLATVAVTVTWFKSLF